MHSNKLVKLINKVINEDKFSKYTIQQVYDELGEEDFMSYIEQICTKIIKSLNNKFKTVSPHIQPGTRISHPTVDYYLANTSDERFTVVGYFDTQSTQIVIYYNNGEVNAHVPSVSIKDNETNIFNKLKSAIFYCYGIKGK